MALGCAGDPGPGDGDESACVTVTSGIHSASGACFEMAMSVAVAIDHETCAFSLEWDMDHGETPTGGAVEPDGTVTLAGGDFAGCFGELDDGTMSGTCPDGCAWEIASD